MCSGRYAALALAAASLTAACGGSTPQPVTQPASPTPSAAVVPGALSASGPDGAIEGRVLGEGIPVRGALVEAVAVQVDERREILLPKASAQTDDRGAFRVSGLAAGRYLVRASDPPVHRETDDEGEALRYPPTYYPGVLQPIEATRVTVARSAAPPRIEFPLKRVRPSRVRGVIKTDDGRQLVSGAVLMTPENSGGLTIPEEDVRILPDGTFTFRNVPPGRYQIRARGETESQGVALFATFALNVTSLHDLTDLTLVLVPGAVVEGRVIVDPEVPLLPPAGAAMRVRAPFSDGTSFGDAPTGDVMQDGSFRIRGVMAGSHAMTVEGAPPGWVVKSVRYRGEELVDAPFDVGPGEQLRDVRVTITNRTSEVSGIVRVSSGSSVPGAVVIVLPLSPQFWIRTSRRLRVGRTDARGRYVVRGLPAGEYRVFASLELDEAEAYTAEALRQAAAAGAPLSLGDRESRTLDLVAANTGIRGR